MLFLNHSAYERRGSVCALIGDSDSSSAESQTSIGWTLLEPTESNSILGAAPCKQPTFQKALSQRPRPFCRIHQNCYMWPERRETNAKDRRERLSNGAAKLLGGGSMFWPGPAEQKQLGRRSDSTHERDSQSQALQVPLAGAIVSPLSGKFTKSGWN